MVDWKNIILAAGGAAGLVAVLHALSKEGAVTDSESCQTRDEKHPVGSIGYVKKILSEILLSQDEIRLSMKELTKELRAAEHTFEEAYQKVARVQPEDPLEIHGLSMTDFESLLDRFQGDPDVRDAISQIMGAQNHVVSNHVCRGEETITVSQIIEVHKFMLVALGSHVNHFLSLPNLGSLEIKTGTTTTQALVSAQIEEKFGLTSEELDAAVLKNQTELVSNPTFARLNRKMKLTMARLMVRHQNN